MGETRHSISFRLSKSPQSHGLKGIQEGTFKEVSLPSGEQQQCILQYGDDLSFVV